MNELSWTNRNIFRFIELKRLMGGIGTDPKNYRYRIPKILKYLYKRSRRI